MRETRTDDEAGLGKTGLHCLACGGAFGFDVRFCPYCSVAQHPPAAAEASVPAAAPAPVAAPRPAALPAARPPVQLPPVAAPVTQAAPVAAPAAPVGPANVQRSAWLARARQAPARPQRAPPALGRRNPPARWRWAAALLGLLVLLQIRSHPGHFPAEANLVVTVFPDVAGRITIDGAPAGGPGEALHVKAGSHLVGFLSADWQAADRQIAVDAGRSSSVALRLRRKPAGAREVTARPPRAADAGRDPSLRVTAYDWTVINDPAGTPRQCGVETSLNGGRLLLYGGSEAPTTLRLRLHKSLWHVPGLTIPVILAFTDGPTFTFQAQGNGPDIAADIPAAQVREFIHHFTADRQATLTLQNGRESPWTLDLRGTSPTITAMAKCLEAAELWLPLPFTQSGG